MARGASLFSACLLWGCLGACSEPPGGPYWRPGVVYRAARGATARGFLDRRGLIHAHSVYSHDACDNEPVKDGVRDPVCFDDFRRGLCQSGHDFVMLSDHNTSFSSTPFPEALLYRVDRGDELVDRGAGPVASFAACPDGTSALVLGGTESATMEVGLEGHVSADEAERARIYGDASAPSIEAARAHGAVALAQHTEDWTVDPLATLPFDGFEMYNLHANTFQRSGDALEYVLRLNQGDANLPDPNLLMLGMFAEDDRYLSRWGSVLARGVRRVTTLGTDCHRNTFPAITPDGERVDSYRRMMIWFSNHLLVRAEADGSWDDRHLKEALRAGRSYGAFEVLGYPVGFDYAAEVGASVSEMGSEIALADAPILSVTAPSIEGLDPRLPAPKLRVRILRAVEGGFEEVASGDGSLRFTPRVAGAYRAEVRITPHHLRSYLGDYGPTILAGDLPWIYANAIYVR